MRADDPRLTAAMIALARANIPTDMQDLLVTGDPMRGIPPLALCRALEASLQSGSAEAVEPVAWRIFDKEEDEWWTTTIENLAKSWSKSTVVEPLFATPAKAAGGWRSVHIPDDLAKHCAEIIAWHRWGTLPDDASLRKLAREKFDHFGDEFIRMAEDNVLMEVCRLAASPSPDGERQEGGCGRGGPADNWTRNKDGAIVGGPGGGGYYADPRDATIAALQSEIARMREALKPFAKEADAWPDHVWEGHGLGHALSVSVTIGHLRAARAALSAPDVTRREE